VNTTTHDHEGVPFGDVLFTVMSSELTTAINTTLLRYRDMLNGMGIRFAMIPDLSKIGGLEDFMNMAGGDWPAQEREWDFPTSDEYVEDEDPIREGNDDE
jgi:hypothetical protein